MRWSTALGLGLVVMLGLSAAVAPGALAEDHYRAAAAPSVLAGSQELKNPHAFVTDGGSVLCNTVEFRATQEAELVNDLTAATVFSGCTAFSFAQAHVRTRDCIFTMTTPAGGPSEFSLDPPHIICPPGNQIEVEPTLFGFGMCTLTVPPQTPTGGTVSAVNIAAPNRVTLTYEVTGIHYTVHSSIGSSLCGPLGGTTTNGVYTGSTLVSGFSDHGLTKSEPVEILDT